MKTKNILSTTILAVAGLVLAASPAQALTSATGDIFAGFRAPGFSTSDYLLDLGSMSQFQTGGSLVDGTIHSLGTVNLGADLTNTFGNWYNGSAGVLWSVFGVVKPAATVGNTSYTTQTMFWSSVESAPGTQSLAQHGYAVGALSTPTNNMVAVQTTYNAGVQTTETQAGGLIQAIGNPNTYGNTTSNFSGTQRFFTLSAGKPVETGFANTPVVLDLYQLNPGATGNSTLLLGGFEIGSNGNISFSSNIAAFASPVPEPASVGTLFSAFLGLVGLSKRRRAARAVQA